MKRVYHPVFEISGVCIIVTLISVVLVIISLVAAYIFLHIHNGVTIDVFSIFSVRNPIFR